MNPFDRKPSIDDSVKEVTMIINGKLSIVTFKHRETNKSVINDSGLIYINRIGQKIIGKECGNYFDIIMLPFEKIMEMPKGYSGTIKNGLYFTKPKKVISETQSIGIDEKLKETVYKPQKEIKTIQMIPSFVHEGTGTQKKAEAIQMIPPFVYEGIVTQN